MSTLSLTDRLKNAPLIVADDVEIRATPYQWQEASALPRRPWVYGNWLLRSAITCVVAPGGAGKSTLLVSMALALATGRPLLGKQTWGGPQRVWLWNLEDDLEELTRSIQAAAAHHMIAAGDIENRLFLDSGLDGARLCTAVESEGQFRLLEPVFRALSAELVNREIDVLIVDPFVSSHEVEENANSKVDRIAKAWGRVAKAANCSIVLVHHTSKAGASDVTALSARGAVALVNAARSTLVINRMDHERADRLGISDHERRRYISVTDDKHNRAPAEEAEWYQLASVDLDNGRGGAAGDSVAVATLWTQPDPFENVTAEHLAAIQRRVRTEQWRANVQAEAWIGKAVAEMLGLDVENAMDKARIKSVLNAWISEGALIEVERPDGKRQMRKWIEAGPSPAVAPPR